MDFEQLEAFVSIARENSYSRAAEKLKKTQPAISLSIKKLESELNAQLFHPDNRTQITDLGEIVLNKAIEIIEMRKEIFRLVEDYKEVKTGKILIGANESISQYLLPNIIVDYLSKYPTIKIEMLRMPSVSIPDALLRRDIDIGFVSYAPHHSQLKSLVAWEDELILIMHPDHPLAEKETVTFSDLGKYTFLAHNVRSYSRNHIESLFKEHNIKMHIVMEISNLEIIKELVLKNLGLAILPKICVLNELNNGKLLTKKVRGMNIQRHLRLLYRRGKEISPPLKAFIDIVQNKK